MRSNLLLEIKVTIGALVIASFYLVSAFLVKESSMKLSSNNMPPGLYPKLIGFLLVATLLWVLITSVNKLKKCAADEDGEGVKLKFVPKNVMVAVGAYVVYLLGLTFIGFVPSNLIFAAGILTYLQPKKLVANVIYAVVFTAICYALFNYVLTIYLPSGIIFR